MFPFLSGHGVSDICGECWVCGPYLNGFFFSLLIMVYAPYAGFSLGLVATATGQNGLVPIYFTQSYCR